MIPSNISTSNILSGIERAEKESYPSNRASDGYDLFYNGKTFPPKVIISYANYFVNKTDLPSAQFSGGDETNLFLIERGFPIHLKPELNEDDFLTELDLYFFNKVIQSGYDSTNQVDQNKAEYIKNNIWRRSKRWAELIANNGDYQITGRTQWNDRYRNGQRFKSYSWYKLHPNKNFHPQVFYTVGVDANDMALVIKLDCQRNGTDKLFLPFQKYFDELKQKRGVHEWRMFYKEELQELDWNKLLKESYKYISETIETYNDTILYINTNHIRKSARICWNDHRWQKPSGFRGKSVTAPQSQAFIHERENGFAPEEWLFDLEKTINEYHYARIEPVNTKTGKHVNERYDLLFYTFNSGISKWYWVGEIKNVEVISKNESNKIYQAYKAKRWWDEQVLQLTEIKETDLNSENLNVQGFIDWNPDDSFNIRFRVEDVVIYPELQPFAKDEKPPSNHYNLPDADNAPEFLTSTELGGLKFEEATDDDTNENTETITVIKRNYTAGLKELINVHYDLQKAFIKYLKSTYPKDKIGKECIRIGYNTRVDVVRKTAAGYIFYEIKTYPDVLTSVRMAIGQLLEYQYYPEQNLAINLIIVTHLKAEPIIYSYLSQLEAQ
jgi:hypothetical protein